MNDKAFCINCGQRREYDSSTYCTGIDGKVKSQYAHEWRVPPEDPMYEGRLSAIEARLQSVEIIQRLQTLEKHCVLK